VFLSFVDSGLVHRHLDGQVVDSDRVGRLLTYRGIPDGMPVFLDEVSMRPVEPLCSWFRHLAYEDKSASQISHLRCMARWSIEQHLPAGLPAWQDHEARRFIHERGQCVGPSVIRSQIALLKMLHQCGQAFTGGGLTVDPWRGKTARQAAGYTSPRKITTAVIPPEQWFPLMRAAWAYVHTFAADILRAQHRYNDLRAAADGTADLQERFDVWLAEPGNRIPVHPTRRSEPAGLARPNLSLLTLMIGIDATNRSSLASSRSIASTRRRDTIAQLIANGHPDHSRLGGQPRHGNPRRWHHGSLEPRARHGDAVA
jgi:hypothetical protein